MIPVHVLVFLPEEPPQLLHQVSVKELEQSLVSSFFSDAAKVPLVRSHAVEALLLVKDEAGLGDLATEAQEVLG